MPPGHVDGEIARIDFVSGTASLDGRELRLTLDFEVATVSGSDVDFTSSFVGTLPPAAVDAGP